MIEIKIKKSSLIYRVFVYLYFMLILIIYLFQYNSIINLLVYVTLAIGGCLGFYISLKRKFYYPIWLALFFSFSWILCTVFQTSLNVNLLEFSYTVFYIGFAVLILEGNFGVLGSGALLLLCIGTIILRNILGVDINNFLTYSSRNYVSVLILFVLLLYYLALLQSNINSILFYLLPAFMFFAESTIAYGRGGIITSGFFLCAVCIFESIYAERKWIKITLRIIMVIVLLFVIYIIFSNQINSFIGRYFGRFSDGLVDEQRVSIWSTFIKNNFSSPKDFLWGSDVSLIRQDKNLHNSFLQCYADFGFIAFITIIILSFRGVWQGILRGNYFWVILFITTLIRAFTDRIFFGNYCGVYLFYFLMYWKYSDKNITKVNKY